MKRRVLIAKALSHEPDILFLDEPTAGVDVELRRDMWNLVRALKASGVTIILTTHYIDEAEEMADRIGVINRGEIILVEEKAELMRKLGKKKLTLQLDHALDRVPDALERYGMELSSDKCELTYTYDAHDEPGRHHRAPAPYRRCRRQVQGPSYDAKFAGRHFREPCQQERHTGPEQAPAWADKGNAMNLHAVRAIYRFEMARTCAHADAEHRVAGDLDVALFRRVRRGDRLAHPGGRRHQLRRVHRAGARDAVAAHAEHLERVVRHLLSEVHRDDLRTAVGADLLSGDRRELRRRGGDEIGDPRPDHSRDRASFRAAAGSIIRSG